MAKYQIPYDRAYPGIEKFFSEESRQGLIGKPSTELPGIKNDYGIIESIELEDLYIRVTTNTDKEGSYGAQTASADSPPGAP